MDLPRHALWAPTLLSAKAWQIARTASVITGVVVRSGTPPRLDEPR
jgi:hypothetical protein